MSKEQICSEVQLFIRFKILDNKLGINLICIAVYLHIFTFVLMSYHYNSGGFSDERFNEYA